MQYVHSTYIAHAELYHHGIKGQKWGVRRFQNDDGSLTAKGIKRYAADVNVNSNKISDIARIRTGEARRKLDIAKENKSSDVRQLKKKLREAKKNEKLMKRAEKGEKEYAKGNTIVSNYLKESMAAGATGFLAGTMMRTLKDSSGHLPAGAKAATAAIAAIGTGYVIKKEVDNYRMHKTIATKMGNTYNKESAGGQEYKDRKKMGQYKG